MTLIETPRLTIRFVTTEDWRTVQTIWADFAGSDYAAFDRPKDLSDEAVRTRIARWEQENRGLDHRFYAVCRNGEMIGFYSLNVCDAGYDLGYGFLASAQGRGYAKESLPALLAYLRQQGITRIFAGTAMKNIPSVRLLFSAGFSLTGRERLSFCRDARGNEIFFEGGNFELNL